MRKMTLVIVLVALLATLALPALAQDPVASVNTGSLNVRTGPSLAFGSVTTLPFGFGVQLIARNAEGNWVQIALTNGVIGWVNVNFLFTQYNIFSLPVADVLEVPATATPIATIDGGFSINLRVGPSEGDAVITTIPRGERVVLLGRNFNSTWAQVRRSDGTTGWVAARTIASATVPVRALALTDGSVFVPFAPGFPGEVTTGIPGNVQTYTIRRGDTLSAIAKQFNLSVNQLAAANRIYDVNRIFIDQVLIIPASR